MQKQLTNLLQGIDYTATDDIGGLPISAVQTDSRLVEPGGLFVCMEGLVTDGHRFITSAAAQGAVAIVANRSRQDEIKQPTLPVIWVDDTRHAIGRLAAAFYDHPSAQLTMIGLTGTNGKTTTSFILEAIIKAAGFVPGVIGTINYRYGGHEYPARFTTPEPLALQALLREMAGHGVTHVIMEVSSHALALQRIGGLSFASALFTNLTRDHLDFHVDMETYYQAKRLLFTDYLRTGSAAVILVDQAQEPASLWGRRLQTDLQALDPGRGLRILTGGLDPGCDITAQHCHFGLDQTTATITVRGHEIPLRSNLIGAFNLKNILGAVGVASGLGLSPTAIGQGLATIIRVPGRLEKISTGDEFKHPAVFVDYAHTPDALENVLMTLRQLSPQRLLVVFGCGGDRDPGKRQIMGEIAGRLADVAIITADNSRSESTEAIMAQIEQGVQKTGKQALDLQAPAAIGYLAISNRAEAIALALQLATARDIVLISGKGHENYQLSAAGSIFFDDRLEAIQGLNQKAAQ